jgi:hypothetical protein
MHSPPWHTPPPMHGVTVSGLFTHMPLLHSRQGPVHFLHSSPPAMQAPLPSQVPSGHLVPALAITQAPVSLLQVLQGPVQSAGHMGLGWHWPFWQVPPGHSAPLTRGPQLRLLALQT